MRRVADKIPDGYLRPEGYLRLQRTLAANPGSEAGGSWLTSAKVLQALPELTWYDAARRQCVIAAILVARLTRRLAVQPVIHLPPAGTTLVEALYAEAADLRPPATSAAAPDGTYAAGYLAGWDMFRRRLRSVADQLTQAGEDSTRPAGGAPVPSERALMEATMRLTNAIAALPSRPQRLRAVLGRSKLVTELSTVLPGQADFRAVLDNLTKVGERLDEVRARLVERRGGGGTTGPDRRWLNALAAKLRIVADTAAGEIGSDPFVAGFTAAGFSVAKRLHARADEIAVPAMWIVRRADRDSSTRMVEVARTESESDARAVVTTMRHHGDAGEYQIFDWDPPF